MKTCKECLEEKPLTDFELQHGNPRNQCKSCRKAQARARAARTPEEEIPHGNTGYLSYACRCEICKTLHAEMHKLQVAKRKAKGPAFWTHGIITTYTNFKCRCLECSEAAKLYAAKRWAAKTFKDKAYYYDKYRGCQIVKREKRKVRDEKFKLSKEDRAILNAYLQCSLKDVCRYCGELKPKMHWDHFFPVAKGGTDQWYNMTHACQPCNLSKKDRCGTWMLLRNGKAKERMK